MALEGSRLATSIGAAFLCLTLACSSAAANMAPKRQVAPGVQPMASASTPCGADKVARFVGQDDRPNMRILLRAPVGHDRIRWIKPGDVITQDYRADRLNVIFDEQGRVAAVRCG